MGRDDTHELYTPLTTMRDIILILFFLFLRISTSVTCVRAVFVSVICHEARIDAVETSHPRVSEAVGIYL
jgi:hypothetical protein